MEEDGNAPEASEESIILMTVGSRAWSRFEGTVLSGQVLRRLAVRSLGTSHSEKEEAIALLSTRKTPKTRTFHMNALKQRETLVSGRL